MIIITAARMLIIYSICFTLIYTGLLYAIDKEFKYEAGDKRDPFVSLIEPGRADSVALDEISSPDSIILEGIAISSGGRYTAIMNGELVKKGDKRGRLVIESITNDAVSIDFDGIKRTLILQ